MGSCRVFNGSGFGQIQYGFFQDFFLSELRPGHPGGMVRTILLLQSYTLRRNSSIHCISSSKPSIQLHNNSSTVTEMKIYSGVGYLFWECSLRYGGPDCSPVADLYLSTGHVNFGIWNSNCEISESNPYSGVELNFWTFQWDWTL